MTVLIDKSQRDSLGIDSFERAIVWSGCLLLSAKNQSVNTYDKNFQISLDEETDEIVMQINLPLDMAIYWASMSNYFLAIKTISETTATYSGDTLTANGTLESEPSTIDNLEKYFAWSCEKLKEYYLTNNLDKKDNISINVNPKTSTLDISIVLTYIASEYTASNNLLKAVLGNT